MGQSLPNAATTPFYRSVYGWVTLAFFVAAGWFTSGFYNMDEHYQILEFAGTKLGRVQIDELTWDYFARVRSWFQPALYTGIISAAESVGIEQPLQLARVCRLVTSLLGWFSIVWLAAALRVWTARPNWFFYTVMTLLMASPMLHARTSSENLSGIFFVLAISTLAIGGRSQAPSQQSKPHAAWFVAIGCLLGASFQARFQMGFMIAGLGIWMVMIGRYSWRPLAWIATGFLLTLAVMALVDRWGYGVWTFPPWTYFRVQILEDRVNDWGRSPWWAYFQRFLHQKPYPVGWLIFAGLGLAITRLRRHPLTWAIVPFILGHCLVGHKEERFIFPVYYLLPAVLTLGLPDFLHGRFASENPRAWRFSRPLTFLLRLTLIVAIPVLLLETLLPLRRNIPVIERVLERSGVELNLLYDGKRPALFLLDTPFYQPSQYRMVELNSQDELSAQLSQLSTGQSAYWMRHYRANETVKTPPGMCQLLSRSHNNFPVPASMIESDFGRKYLGNTVWTEAWHCSAQR